MKRTDALYDGNEPRWGLQPRMTEPAGKPTGSAFHRGFVSLQQGYGAGSDRAQLRTYGASAEKFSHSEYREPPSGLIGVQHKAPGVPSSRRHETWGVGGEAFKGTRKVPGPLSSDAQPPTGVRKIEPAASDEYSLDRGMGRKRQVFDGEGNSLRNMRSDEYGISDVMQRKQPVPEEARTEHRSIDRPAPAGMKGFLGAEYSNDYWKLDGAVVRMKMKPSKADLAEAELRAAAERGTMLGHTKTFAQKRIDADLIEQQELVSGLTLDYDNLSDDDAPVEDS